MTLSAVNPLKLSWPVLNHNVYSGGAMSGCSHGRGIKLHHTNFIRFAVRFFLLLVISGRVTLKCFLTLCHGRRSYAITGWHIGICISLAPAVAGWL